MLGKKIVMADDHSVVRDGLKAIIQQMDPNVDIVGEAADGRELLELAETTRADVYLVDISMPAMSGIEATKRLLKHDPTSKVIILSMYKDKVLVEKAIKAGAKGYVLKEGATEEITRAIEEVYEGRYYFSADISAHLVHGFLYGSTGSSEDKLEASLTDRQREILKLICDGYTEKDIGEQLNISYHTVHVHKNNIMKALDIHSKAELIKYAIKQRIIQI